MAANVMFDLDPVHWSTKERATPSLAFAEGVATLGLLLVVFGVVRSGKPTLAAFSVGGYIAGAYFFTSSTSFANPAVTAARTFSDTFAGIEPASAPMFVVAQIAAVAVGAVLIKAIYPDIEMVSDHVVVPQQQPRNDDLPQDPVGPAPGH